MGHGEETEMLFPTMMTIMMIKSCRQSTNGLNFVYGFTLQHIYSWTILLKHAAVAKYRKDKGYNVLVIYSRDLVGIKIVADTFHYIWRHSSFGEFANVLSE